MAQETYYIRCLKCTALNPAGSERCLCGADLAMYGTIVLKPGPYSGGSGEYTKMPYSEGSAAQAAAFGYGSYGSGTGNTYDKGSPYNSQTFWGAQPSYGTDPASGQQTSYSGQTSFGGQTSGNAESSSGSQASYNGSASSHNDGASPYNDGVSSYSSSASGGGTSYSGGASGGNDSSASDTEGPKKKKKGPVIAIIILVCVILVLVLVFALYARKNNTEDEDETTTEETSADDSGNVLMADDGEDTVLGSTYARADILSVTFTDTIKDSDTAWDVSASENGSVMAWVEENGSGYDLYIGADGSVYLSSGAGLFENYTNAVSISFNDCLNTVYASDFSAMFSGCQSLESLDLSSLDTSNVTNMDSVFGGCISLTSLDLDGLDTSNVTSMSLMFCDCESLRTLDLSSFDTSNVTDMFAMFDHCHALESLDLSSFDTSAVKDMADMFYTCKSLTSLDLSSFDTSAVKDMSEMFYGCSSLSDLNVSSFDTSNVTDMSEMFYGCSSLTSLDLSNFTISENTDTDDMFTDAGISAKEAGLSIEEEGEEASSSASASNAYVTNVIDGTQGVSGENYENLFDGDASTKWCVTDFDGIALVAWEMSEEISVSYILITTAADHTTYPERSPISMVLYGVKTYADIYSNSTDDWYVIDYIYEDYTLYTDASDCEVMKWTNTGDTVSEYKYFVLVITDVAGGTTMQIADVELID